ncbi:MAG: glycosyltransferase [Alphaproteobacteria bacterium]|nr:MAG: glycosyltransferase [Alphaproteobacteria bacterium]
MKSSLYALGSTVLVTTNQPDTDDLYLETDAGARIELVPVSPDNAFKGQNLIRNIPLEGEPAVWAPTDADLAAVGSNLAPEWTAEAAATGYFRLAGPVAHEGAVYMDPVFGDRIPVLQHHEYVLSARLAAHRCVPLFRVDLMDKSGTVIKTIEKSFEDPLEGGADLNRYDFSFMVFFAPKGTCFARIQILAEDFAADAKDHAPFVFFVLPSLTLARGKIIRGWSEPRPELLHLQQDLHDPRTCLLKPEQDLPIDAGTVHLRSADGESVASAPIVFAPLVSSPIVLSGRRVAAHIRHRDGGSLVDLCGDAGRPSTLGLAMYVDGECDNVGFGQKTGNLDVRMLSMRIASKWFDGQAHHLELRTFEGQLLAQDILILSPNTLDYEGIRRFSMPPYRNQLSPLAGYRYRALQAQMARAAELGPEGVAQVALCHELVSTGFEKNKTFLPLVFPEATGAKVSVIVPVHNKFEVTYNCLASLLLAYNDAAFEVVVVDDGSSDRTLELGALVQGIQIVRHDKAKGFVGACNAGAAAASGDYVVLLNNDTEVTNRWLDELLFLFDQFEGVGLAGSKLIYPDGTLQEAGGVVWADGVAWNYGKHGNAYDPIYNYVRSAHYCSGAAVIVARAVWEQVGGLSEAYAPAYYEDTDLAFSVRAAGFKTLYAPQSVVVHYEGISNGTEVASSGLKRFQEINRPKFVGRWPDFFKTAPSEGENALLHKDEGIERRALFMDYQVPRTDYDAGSYAAVQEIRLMQSLGYKVTFIPANLAYLGKYVEQLQRMGVEVVYAPFYVSVEEFMQMRGREFDLVYITRYHVAQDNLQLVRNHAPQAKVLFNNADLHFLREIRAAVQSGDEEALEQARETRGRELAVMRNVDVTLSYNDVEHAVILSHNMEHSTVMKAPWVVDVAADVAGFREREGIAFLGGYAHPPNVDAAVYFVKHVMPVLREKMPGIALYIYGSSVTETVKALAADDVHVVGHVENVADVYESHRLFVAPLLSGAGIKGKVVAAMAHGIPSILSPIAAEGTGARHAYDCHIAATVDEWVASIEALYADEESWALISERSRDFVARNYSFARARQDLLNAVKAVECPYEEEAAGLFIRSASMKLEP